MKLASGPMAAACLALAIGGCSKKPPKELPPAPSADVGSGQDVYDPEGELRELQRDFAAQAGSDSVYFDTDSSVLDAEDRATLSSQARWLAAHPRMKITVEGHCDERGTREYNLALGERRATAAKNYLAVQGIDVSRIRTLSWGKERPAALGSDASAWSQNRRAVTILIGNQ